MTPKMPYLRKQSEKKGVWRIEVMSDSMRVGKTTAVKVIAEGLKAKGYRVCESFEDWQNNPYLKKSYSDPAKSFLNSQKWFIKRKHQQIVDGAILRQGSKMVNVFVQDVSPEMDYCYADTNVRLGRMSEDDFAKYREYYYSLVWSDAPAPDVLVYLEVSDEELIQRAMDSRREFESVDPAYFLMMKKVNREWLEGSRKESDYRVLGINTDHLDFATQDLAKQELVEKVITKLQSER